MWIRLTSSKSSCSLWNASISIANVGQSIEFVVISNRFEQSVSKRIDVTLMSLIRKAAQNILLAGLEMDWTIQVFFGPNSSSGRSSISVVFLLMLNWSNWLINSYRLGRWVGWVRLTYMNRLKLSLKSIVLDRILRSCFIVRIWVVGLGPVSDLASDMI